MTLCQRQRRHLVEMERLSGAEAKLRKNWRNHVFFEYYFVNDNTNVDTMPPQATVSQLSYSDSFCGDLTAGKNSRCWSGKFWCKKCYATESASNNFRAVRFMKGRYGDTCTQSFSVGAYTIHVGKSDRLASPDFYEIYDSSADPWMMHNLLADPQKPISAAQSA